MKNLIRTMISGIAYLRSLFPEDFFRDEVIGGLHVKLLLAKDAAARRLTSWVEDGVFDAFDRGYLSEAVLGVYLDEGAPRRLAESYSFRVRYSTLSVARAAGGEAAGQASVLHPGKEDIHRAITEALRKQVVQSGVMRALPAEKFLTLKLIYTEDTPQDYRPKAADFRPTAERLTFDGAPETCLLGRVATQFHTLGITSFAASQPPHERYGGAQLPREPRLAASFTCAVLTAVGLLPLCLTFVQLCPLAAGRGCRPHGSTRVNSTTSATSRSPRRHRAAHCRRRPRRKKAKRRASASARAQRETAAREPQKGEDHCDSGNLSTLRSKAG